MIADHSILYNGSAWRIAALVDVVNLLAPARAPEGRSHRDGQAALYLSLSPEGCVVATARYTDADTPARGIYPLAVRNARVVDLRDRVATDWLGIDTTHRAAEWQSLRAKGLPSPTWDIADRVRDLGLDGMIYASRSDPSKAHLTMFRWNNGETAATVEADGPPLDPAIFVST